MQSRQSLIDLLVLTEYDHNENEFVISEERETS